MNRESWMLVAFIVGFIAGSLITYWTNKPKN